MSRMKTYLESVVVVDNLIKACKLEGDFVGYKELKTIKEKAFLGDRDAITKMFKLLDMFSVL